MACASCFVVAFLLIACSGGQARGEEARGKPNIILILADDQAFDSVHALGNPVVQTPNLDRLVETGVTFTHAYNMGGWSGAVCVPSRTMLNTGRFLWHTQPREGKSVDAQMFEEGKLWSQLLAEAGYDTYMTGKWHLRADATKAFTVAGHVRPGMPKDTPEGYDRPKAGEADPWEPWDSKRGGYWEGGTHWSEVVRNDAVAFIERAAGRDKPFFMYLAFNAPHDPRQSPKEYVERYPLERIDLPANFLPTYPFMDDIGCGPSLRDERLAPFPRTPHAVRVHRQEYYAIITHMDTQIGLICEALERSGLKDRTYVLFTADHGLAVGHHGLMGKQNLFDHSVRVPLMVNGPGMPSKQRIEARVYLQDAMPTALELAGAAKPDHVQFQSLLPLIRGQRDQSYEAIYSAYLDFQRAVTQGDHKLILYPKIKKALLFDLANDPLEMHDLADDSAHRDTIHRLFATLLKLQKETGDPLDIRAVYPDL